MKICFELWVMKECNTTIGIRLRNSRSGAKRTNLKRLSEEQNEKIKKIKIIERCLISAS